MESMPVSPAPDSFSQGNSDDLGLSLAGDFCVINRLCIRLLTKVPGQQFALVSSLY